MKTLARNQRLFVSLLLCLAWCIAGLNSVAARPATQAGQPLILWLTADGPLTPAMVEYIQRGLENAARQSAEAVVIELNTPGGGVTLMNQIVTSLRASEVTVVVYIAPRGAMAGSAGSVITLAGHAAAMAPETTIGAASPVGMQGEDLDQTSLAKETNILKATMRSLAERRGSQAVELAEAMIETAQAVSSQEALQAGLIDFIASDQSQLLEQLDGFQVETVSGTRRLETTGAAVEIQSASLIEELLSVLTDPNIVFLLITIGVQSILIEISSPGGWVAGTIGVVCLALAFYGVGVLDVNWFGGVFLILAFALFILDLKAPTHGALTVAGVVALIVGALVLFNSPNLPASQPRVSIPLVILMSLMTGGVFFGVLMFAMRARKIPIRVGAESLVGRRGRALSPIRPFELGQVRVASEQWSAELLPGEDEIPAGSEVEVIQVSGLRLVVKRPRPPAQPGEKR